MRLVGNGVHLCSLLLLELLGRLRLGHTAVLDGSIHLLAIIVTQKRHTMLRHSIHIHLTRHLLLLHHRHDMLPILTHHLKLLWLITVLLKEHVFLLLPSLVKMVKDWVLDIAEAKPSIKNCSTVFFVPLSEPWVLVELG